MVHITIEPATADRFDDAQHALTGGGDGGSCQCQWWMMPNSQWEQTSSEERKEMLRREIAEGPPPALLAYVDGEAAGWLRVGPRTRQMRLGLTRNFVKNSEEPWEDPAVWAVTCFVVRREHRRTGLNARLLASAIDYARRSGARMLEAYPLDPASGRRKTSNELFHGVLSTFEQAGFREVARARPDLAIVSLDLTT